MTITTKEEARVLRPYCNDCGWRKGGRDSWNGVACKCGHQMDRQGKQPAHADNGEHR
jgi:hypothetical protein